MAILSCDYSKLNSLHKKLGIPEEEIYHAIENGILRACVWLPLRYIERFSERNKKLICEKHETQEGFVGLRPEDFRRIYSSGRTKLKVFNSIAKENHILRLAYELPQPSLSVSINDIVVLNKDITKFQERYVVKDIPYAPIIKKNAYFNASNDYRYVKLGDKEFHFGGIQANIIKQLYEASKNNNPWIHGKTLLNVAGSGATRLRDIFKNRNFWCELIISSGRGYYRLNIENENLEQPSAIKKF